MNVLLIGYRGCGKSTVGRLLAEKLDLDFVDTDDEIEKRAGMSIREIFKEQGESGFRDRESEVIEDVCHPTTHASGKTVDGGQVISLGGGAPLRELNRKQISSAGHVIWLQGSAESLFARISTDVNTDERRPQLSDRGGFDEVAEILEKRTPIYSELANFAVQTDAKSPELIVEEIVDWLEGAGEVESST
jgi:shikimate kinase